jgi:hypothetical protein
MQITDEEWNYIIMFTSHRQWHLSAMHWLKPDGQGGAEVHFKQTYPIANRLLQNPAMIAWKLNVMCYHDQISSKWAMKQPETEELRVDQH